MGSVKKAGDLLSSLFNEHFDPVTLASGRLTAGLFSFWVSAAREANIPAAADHSRIRELEHNVLVIEAEHPGWVQILQTKQNQLLKLVQVKFPELGIQGISFCLSREPISSITVPSPAETRIDDLKGNPPENLNESIEMFKKVLEKKKLCPPI